MKVISTFEVDETLKTSFSNKAKQRGSKAYAAFPLFFNNVDKALSGNIYTLNKENNDKEDEQFYLSMRGVLYIHYWQEHQFMEELEPLRVYFANKASDAIMNAVKAQKAREKARQLAALQCITQSFNEIGNPNLVSYIAWNTLNALAADVVIIYEFNQAENKLSNSPIDAGKFLTDEEKDIKTIAEDAVPWSLIKHGKNIYAPKLSNEVLLKYSPFAKREKIQSASGILLKVNNEVVGVMFINYRRFHAFSNEEKQIITSLASSSAIAIQNQRWRETLDSIGREIIINHESINLILQKAVQITGADVGEISIFDPNTTKLITRVNYPDKKMCRRTPSWQEVKRYQQSKMVNDVENEGDYEAYFRDIISELRVSLFLDKEIQCGMLIVGSFKKETFNLGNIQQLTQIAALAVIAIQSEEKEKQVKQKTIATVGNISRKLLNRIETDAGTTKAVLSILKEIISSISPEINSKEILNSGSNTAQISKYITAKSNVEGIINNLKIDERSEGGISELLYFLNEVDKTLNAIVAANNVEKIINNLNEANVEDTKDKVSSPLLEIDEVDKDLKPLVDKTLEAVLFLNSIKETINNLDANNVEEVESKLGVV